MTKIADYSGVEWKTTLLDASRAFTVTETEADVLSGASITLHYKKATTGTNEYVSAILADADGNALYYSRLVKPSGATGTVTVKVPAELSTGSYTLKVFSEQRNADYNTDFASAFSDVALTVTTPLDAAKAAAKTELETYKDPAAYRPAQQTELETAVSAGQSAIDAAGTTEAVADALSAAKAVIDAIKTDAELTAEELDADIAAANEVEEKIAAIGKVVYTKACKAKIDAARAAYDALTDAQKTLVENYDVLTAAEARYAKLKAEAETPAEPEAPCKWCGERHGSSFGGRITAFFHSILYFFAHLFGKR